jgi:hypothetical protein
MSETSLHSLIEALRSVGPSRELDYEVWAACGLAGDHDETVPALTFSLDAAVSLSKRVMPGWSWRAAECHVSDDAWLIPDFLDPEEGERLRAAYRQDIDWTDLTDVDLRPSGRPAVALCMSVLLALEASRKGEYRGLLEQVAPLSADQVVRRRDEMVVVPKSMLTELCGFFHETSEGDGWIDEARSFGEELLHWRERIQHALNMARYRKVGQEDKP